MTKKKVVILGAAGRDFHNFNMLYRDREEAEVIAFTATQIPDIEGRMYPTELAGELYPKGIPIIEETEFPELVRREVASGASVDVVFSYFDVPHRHVMRVGSQALTAGGNFVPPSPTETMISSSKPAAASPRPPGRSRIFSPPWAGKRWPFATPCPTAI